jgi:hypothetical protein
MPIGHGDVDLIVMLSGTWRKTAFEIQAFCLNRRKVLGD